MDSDHIENQKFGNRDKLVLATLAAGIVVIVWGTKTKGWYFAELSAVFLLMGLVSGFIMGWGPNEIAEKVAKSFSEMCIRDRGITDGKTCRSAKQTAVKQIFFHIDHLIILIIV